MRNSVLLLVLIGLFAVPDALAQDDIYVGVNTNYPQALVYADSLLIGSVPDGLVVVPGKTRALRLVPPDPDSWSVAPVSTPLDAEAGDTVEVQLDFLYHYRVESVPFGADVLLEDERERRRIGETPLLYRSPRPLSGKLLVRLDGYAVERVVPGQEIWNRHVVSMMPSDDLDPTAAQVSWTPPRRHRDWIDYAALGTAVAAGVLAVRYKFKADGLHATYHDTGDPRIRSDIQMYDTRSAVALGVMQAGIGVFAVRLALR
ncbi:MAG: hypothetical protein WD021_10915 [Rhodothermales bacterium]